MGWRTLNKAEETVCFLSAKKFHFLNFSTEQSFGRFGNDALLDETVISSKLYFSFMQDRYDAFSRRIDSDETLQRLHFMEVAYEELQANTPMMMHVSAINVLRCAQSCHQYLVLLLCLIVHREYTSSFAATAPTQHNPFRFHPGPVCG